MKRVPLMTLLACLLFAGCAHAPPPEPPGPDPLEEILAAARRAEHTPEPVLDADGHWTVVPEKPDLAAAADDRWAVALGLEKLDLPWAAYLAGADFRDHLSRLPQRERHELDVIEQALRIEAKTGDIAVIPMMLDQTYNYRYALLPQPEISHINSRVALICLSQRKFQDADDFAKAVPENVPDFASALYLRALARVLDPKHDAAAEDDALAFLDRVRKVGTPRLASLALLARARIAFDRRHFEEAAATYAEVTLPADWVDAVHEGAWAELLSGHPDRALERARSLAPGTPETVALLDLHVVEGHALRALHREEEAVAVFEATRRRVDSLATNLDELLESVRWDLARVDPLTSPSPLEAPYVEMRQHPVLRSRLRRAHDLRTEAIRLKSLLNEPVPDRLSNLLHQLEAEADAADTFARKVAIGRLRKTLSALYDLSGGVEVLLLKDTLTKADHADALTDLTKVPADFHTQLADTQMEL